MEICTNCAGTLIADVVKCLFYSIKRRVSYGFLHKEKLKNFEKKVENLAEKRDRVQQDVVAAENKGEEIHTDVKNWLIRADNIINAELKEVKGLEDKAKNKCLIGLCPNFKARCQLSKKAEDDAKVVDELLQQGGLDKVSYRVVPPSLVYAPPKYFEAFDSRKQVLSKIVEAVKDPSINIIGVYGMAGVGKTTLVKEVIRQVEEKKLFDSVVMVAVTHNPDIKKIQDQIADRLGLKFEEQSLPGRADRLRARLKKEKKILVVLDDIWVRLDPMEVGIPFGDEHPGCKMLLTSRDLDVLDCIKSFQIEVLTPNEAWDLFKKMAGDGFESPDLESIAIGIAKKCTSLPIAISTVARALRNKPLFAWKDALRQLNKPSSSNFKGVMAGAYSAIELSYNLLDSQEKKETFLLCSLMGHHASIRDLLKYAMGLGLFDGVSAVEETRNRLLTVVSNLKASCLLLDSYYSKRFDMHDLICDVAISIASKDNHVFALRHEDVLNDWPDGGTTKNWDKISLRHASISKLPDHLECPKLTFFCMVSKDPSMKVPTNFFKEMKKLKVLDLTKMIFPSLPLSISLHLRTLCLDHCDLGDIALIGELKNLEVLSLVRSDIEMLPMEIGQLIKLKLFDLSHCSKLKRIPSGVLCNLTSLEELYMGNSFVQWEADGHPSEQSNTNLAELGALSCLTALDIQIPDAKIIPKDFFLEKLQGYNIFIGEAWDWDWDGEIEYSRTLKLKLQTSIGFLNSGIKVLLKKAENLHLDEMKGVEVLLKESEARECSLQLKNLHIQNGATIQYIIEANYAVQTMEFLQLKSLTLQGLPKLISFCSKNNGSTSISPQGMALFNQMIVFPKLEKLKLSSIGIERIWLPGGFHSTQNLTSLIIEGCSNLKQVLSYAMVECLQQLECLEISKCECIQKIISTEETTKEASEIRAPISFPRLNSLKLKDLQKLIGFCHEDFIVEFPSLTILKIKHCPELKEFINKSMSEGTSADEVLFNGKVAFPNLKIIKISHLGNVNRIWCNQLNGDSFSKLKELEVRHCDALLNIFSSFQLEVFQRLETLAITDCASLEEVFQLQVQGLETKETCAVATQLRQVFLFQLPKLKQVWNMDPNGNISFENLRKVDVRECWNLKTLFPFSLAEGLQQLESLSVVKCGVEEIVSKSTEGVEQRILFQFNQLSFLMLWNLPDLMCFYPEMHSTTWPVLKKLRTVGCEKIKIFGQVESQIQQPVFLIEKVIPQLEEVSFSSDDVAMICDGQFAADFFYHIKLLRISGYLKESDVFPVSFLQRFYNLEMLAVISCNFKELTSYEGDVSEEINVIVTLPKIKKLKLNGVYNIRSLWKQDSPLEHICASLETLEVWNCDSLINLSSASSSFQYLTTLDVWKCKEIAVLITSSKAQSLERLVTMRIRECEMITYVIASKGDEATYEIIFGKLKCLELHCLQSLKSFCSGNDAFKFPSLEQVIVSQCPILKNFCQGDLSTPKLQKVQQIETDYKGRWFGDLNATVKQLYVEQVGYRGLKHLKFSKSFPS